MTFVVCDTTGIVYDTCVSTTINGVDDDMLICKKEHLGVKTDVTVYSYEDQGITKGFIMKLMEIRPNVLIYCKSDEVIADYIDSALKIMIDDIWSVKALTVNGKTILIDGPQSSAKSLRVKNIIINMVNDEMSAVDYIV